MIFLKKQLCLEVEPSQEIDKGIELSWHRASGKGHMTALPILLPVIGCIVINQATSFDSTPSIFLKLQISPQALKSLSWTPHPNSIFKVDSFSGT